jgi:hypothetical protein
MSKEGRMSKGNGNCVGGFPLSEGEQRGL